MLSEDGTFGSGPYALTLPEILLQILEKLDARNLMNVALVCKVWTWPAVDIGWRTCSIRLSSVLAPLLKCKPLQLCGRDQLEAWDEAEKEETPTESWRQYQLNYGAKVTIVTCDITPDDSFNSRLEILMGFHRGPICPHLRNLTFSVHTENDGEEDVDRWSPLLSLLVSSTLSRFRLSVCNATRRVAAENIKILTRIAPRIQHVFIENWAEFSIHYSAFRRMKNLKVQGHIGHTDWRSLADCPQLERVVLQDILEIGLQPQNYSVSLPHLRTLSVGSSFEYASADFTLILFQNTIMPMLGTLEVGIHEPNVMVRDAVKGEILKFPCRRSLVLKEVAINGRVMPGYDDITPGSLDNYVDY
ncbi:hypothetical protein FRB95_004869 [Tulasnella sp. JGI-2019a]|nr:hypothetical protein FRB95_004869 [Tulasnella sp. JGI-2019a]